MSTHLTRELEQLLEADISDLLPLPSGQFVVYGAGSCGAAVARALAQQGRSVAAFLDAHRAGETHESAPVFSPLSSEARELAKDGVPIVVAVFNYATDLLPIVAALEELGFERIISYHEFHELGKMPQHFWLSPRHLYAERKQLLRETWNLLSDEVSQRLFLDSVRLRLTFDLNMLRHPDRRGQYLPEDLPLPRGSLQFIDAGAFTGDTIEYFLAQGAEFEAIAAFEPDPTNFRALTRFTQNNLPHLGEISLWPCGLGQETGQAYFQSDRGSGSVVTESGNLCVQVVALDDVMPRFCPTYIKMDIEGAEMAALRGGAEMISRSQPSLAICAYHAPEHLWEVPLKIHELLPSHQIALRCHACNSFELVAYAFPQRE